MTQISTLYPGSNDSFSVPSSPSTTPLSSAGSSTRNHVSSHRDMGDAIVALQANATKSTHLHSGVGIDGPKLPQANTHLSPDTDSGVNALHHTLGLGVFQAATGNHNHDSRYLRMDANVDQTITGKKTFPSGSTGIAIPDFQNAQHNHLNAGNGGPSYGLEGHYTWDRGDFGGNATEDDFIHTNRFTLPAFTSLTGTVFVSFYLDCYTGGAGAGDINHRDSDVFFYLSYNQGESPAFSTSKNIIPGGENFGGTMRQNNHRFENTGIPVSTRPHIAIPIYIPSSVSARTNMAIVTRIVNNTPLWLKGLNYFTQIQFNSPNFITL